MIIEKIKTSLEIYNSLETKDEKLNLFKSLIYNFTPHQLKKE